MESISFFSFFLLPSLAKKKLERAAIEFPLSALCGIWKSAGPHETQPWSNPPLFSFYALVSSAPPLYSWNKLFYLFSVRRIFTRLCGAWLLSPWRALMNVSGAHTLWSSWLWTPSDPHQPLEEFTIKNTSGSPFLFSPTQKLFRKSFHFPLWWEKLEYLSVFPLVQINDDI